MLKNQALSSFYLDPSDVSQGKEKVAVSLHDPEDIDSVVDFVYVLCNIPGPCMPHHKFKEQIVGCGCEGVTSCGKQCSCMASYGPAYNHQGVLITQNAQQAYHNPILECNRQCKCSAKCHNRVVQKGIRYKLQVFKTDRKGYGLRTLEDIPKNKFVCEYAGEILPYETACLRSKTLSEAGSANYYVLVLKEHIGSGETLNTYVDPMYVGNVGRFVNHACDPNLYMVPVRINNSIPHLALFTGRDISSGEELTFNYSGITPGQKTDSESEDQEEALPILAVDGNEADLTRRVCHCGTAKCQGYLPFDRTLFKDI